MNEGVLTEMLQDAGFGAGWRALGEAGTDGGFGAGVAEEEVLDDLLDAPLVDVQSRMELGLGGEAMEQLAFFFAGLITVEIEEVVDAQAVGRSHEAVDGYMSL